MSWISKSLNRKFIAGTAAGLLISLLVFLVLFATMYRAELKRERAEAVMQVNSLLQTSLENAMLKRDLDGLRGIIDRLGTQSNISGVMIANPAGQVRFSNHPSRLGMQLDRDYFVETVPATRFILDESGNEVLRSINPVHNKSACGECHGPIEKSPINGTLFVGYEATSIRNYAQNKTLLLMGSGALIVFLNIGGGWWFIRKYVLKPVNRLAAASHSLSQGVLDTRVTMPGCDELADFGGTFNRMAANLQDNMRALEEHKSYLQSLIDAIPDGVRVIDDKYRIHLVNKAYREQLQLPADSEENGPCYLSSHHRDSPCPASLTVCPVKEITENSKPLKFIHRHKCADESALDVEVYAAPVQASKAGKNSTLIVESIRNLSQAARFSHEQKLSELGRLAAGMAHEIYNPLTSIRLALHSAQKADDSADEDAQDTSFYMQIVDREIDSCINVTERLLKLSTPPSSQPELVSVNDTVSETISLLKWEAQEQGIELIVEFEEPGLRVIATDSEMRILALNLTQNAFHAMPDGGQLKVSAVRSDNFIKISFADTGVGIHQEAMHQIFEPFFSRRADGARGTGLGLSICRMIVENYDGALEAKSTFGEGSCFTIRLPSAESLKYSEE